MGILKLGGLASGLDTEGLIKTLMSLERRPVQLLEGKRDKLQTQANAYRDVNNRLLTLQNRLNDLKGLTDDLWRGKKATVADSTILRASVTSTTQPGTYTVEVLTLATATIWESGQMASAVADPNAKLNIAAGTIAVGSGPNTGATFDVVEDDSLTSIANKINDKRDQLGLTASVVQVSPGDYRLVLTSDTGAANDFSLVDQTGTAGASLKITTGSGATKRAVATDGQIEVNDVPITIAGNEVKDAIGGATLNLEKTGTTKVTVTNDTDKVVSAVKKFIDQYNSVIDFLNQQTAYDAKTKKASTLFGERQVVEIKNGLSNQIFEAVEGLPVGSNILGAVGITTEGLTGTGDAAKVSQKLKLDENKFTEALLKDPEGVKKLFVGNDGTTKGAIVRTAEWLDNFTKPQGILLGQVDVRDKDLERIKERIDQFNDRILPAKEKFLRNQFVAMEKTLSTLQQQGNWLSSQIKSLAVPQQQ